MTGPLPGWLIAAIAGAGTASGLAGSYLSGRAQRNIRDIAGRELNLFLPHLEAMVLPSLASQRRLERTWWAMNDPLMTTYAQAMLMFPNPLYWALYLSLAR